MHGRPGEGKEGGVRYFKVCLHCDVLHGYSVYRSMWPSIGRPRLRSILIFRRPQRKKREGYNKGDREGYTQGWRLYPFLPSTPFLPSFLPSSIVSSPGGHSLPTLRDESPSDRGVVGIQIMEGGGVGREGEMPTRNGRTTATSGYHIFKLHLREPYSCFPLDAAPIDHPRFVHFACIKSES